MGKEFLLKNYKIQFDDKFIAYNELKKQFQISGDKAKNEFIESYQNTFLNIDDVHEKGISLGYSIIGKYLDEAISVLIFNDILHIDKNEFIEKYYSKYLDWEDNFEKVDERYRKIVFSAEEEKEYREQRKDSRGRWQGGGFGMSAAIKGGIEAGAMNIATGMAHSVFNSIANKMTDAITEDEKVELFKDTSIIKDLAFSIYYNVYKIHYAVVDALKDNNKVIGDYVTNENSKKASALINNLKTGLIPVEKEEIMVNEIIHNNPYNKEVYLFLMGKYGDENKGIEDICNFLNINVSDKKLDLLLEHFNSLPKDTEENTIKSMEEFKEFAEKININEIQDYINKFNEILKQHDISIRTVDGILFDTREESTLATKEYNEISSIINKTNYNSEASVLSSIEQLSIFETILKDKYLNILNEKLVEAIRYEDQLYLDENFSVNSIVNEEEADKLIASLKDIKLRNQDLVISRLKEIEEKRISIIESIDKETIDRYFSTVVILNESDLRNEINNIENFNIRTVRFKEDLINYLNLNSEKIMKKHKDLLDRAIKYEARINTVKQEAKPEKKGVFGFISKVVEKSANLMDSVQEKREKEGWDFITNNGTRSINSIINRK